MQESDRLAMVSVNWSKPLGDEDDYKDPVILQILQIICDLCAWKTQTGKQSLKHVINKKRG